MSAITPTVTHAPPNEGSINLRAMNARRTDGVHGMDVERTVSLNCVLAAGLWVIMVSLLIAGTIVGLSVGGRAGEAVARSLLAAGLASAIGATMFTLKNMLKRQDRLIQHAYELGRESSSPTPLRRAPLS